jgi:hypothetical protein
MNRKNRVRGYFRGRNCAIAALGVGTACYVASAVPATLGQTNISGDQGQIDRGRYMVRIAGCNDCHTAGYTMTGGKVEESGWLTGDNLGFRGPWGTTYPPNLRLIINSLTEEQWMSLARNLHARPPMPWWILHDMSEKDLKAMYAFVKWLGPAGQPAPRYAPPGENPAGPTVDFPAPPGAQPAN